MVAGPYYDSFLFAGRSYSIVCQNQGGIISKGIWMNHNPLEYTTPLLLLQLSVISITSKLIDVFLKPLGQSSTVSQIIGGIIFGPSVLGHEDLIANGLFPARGAMIFHTFATFGIVFFLFTVGMKMDSSMMVRPGRQAIAIGISVTLSTLALTAALSLILTKYLPMDDSLAKALPLLASSQTLTAFPNIACLLDELKIINTDLGRLALSSAMFCDIIGISLTMVVFSLLQTTEGNILMSMLSVLSSVALLVVIVCVIRPVVQKIVKRIPPGKPVGEMYVMFVFITILVTTLFSETIGQHFVLGPLILGLAMPDGPPLGAALASKLDTLASGLLYPTYLTDSGLKTDIFRIHLQSVWIVGFLVLFASLVKIGAVMLTAPCINVPLREALVLGLVLNARGICELMVYNLWRSSELITGEEFTLAVISVIAVTGIITPLIKALYDPFRQRIPIKRRTIQHAKREAELRILVCIHNQDNVPLIINLLEASNATETSPIPVIAVLLVELVGRANPILIAHQLQQTLEKGDPKSYHIINALQHYELRNEGCATVQSFSSISRFNTMHEDICRVAIDQNASIVIMPFHKQWAIDGTIESVNRSIRTMNLNVLNKAPSSVGILIDRGILHGSLSIINSQSIYQVLVIYIGGADDGEALSCGARMVKHKNVTLTVMRFLLFGSDNARERKLDNDLINEVCHARIGNKRLLYREEVVRDGVGLASSITGLENGYDLIIVGRSHHEPPLLLGLHAWSECTELGVIGDMLASPDFGSTASVLVVQQQRFGGKLINRATKQVVNVNGIDPLLSGVQCHGVSARSTGNNRASSISFN